MNLAANNRAVAGEYREKANAIRAEIARMKALPMDLRNPVAILKAKCSLQEMVSLAGIHADFARSLAA